jgi:hypothetical protein
VAPSVFLKEEKPLEAKEIKIICLFPTRNFHPTYKTRVAVIASSFGEMMIWLVEGIKNYSSKAVLQCVGGERKGQYFSYFHPIRIILQSDIS